MKISRILHAGYLFESANTRIVFDPIFESPFSVNCHAFPAVRFDRDAISRERFDAVVISHFHDDHFSLKSLSLIDRATPIHMFGVHESLFGLVREMGFRSVVSLTLDLSVRIGDFKVTARRALDADVDCLLQIESAEHRVLNVVDSWIDDETLARLRTEGPWDVVLWPFQTMREIEAIAPAHAESADGSIPDEWKAQLQALNPRLIVPSSCQFAFEEWSWLNRAFFPISYRGFAEQAARILPHAQILRLDPGEAIELVGQEARAAAPLSWIARADSRVVDYDYDPNAVAPPTREIAARFASLTPDERRRLDLFLATEMPAAYGRLQPLDDSLTWRLTIYDGDRVDEHHFRIEGAELVPTGQTEPGWRTEIVARKLLGALDEGESLSSLYLRVSEADVLADPLIRVLYGTEIGSYQRAQLRRLREGPRRY